MSTTTVSQDDGTAPRRRFWPRWLAACILGTVAVGCASLPANTGRTASRAYGEPQMTQLGQLVAQRRGAARADSGFVILDSVDAALASRLALIDAAQRTLDLQYYAIHADASTELILQHLKEAAQRGVRVRLLLDDFNAVGKDAQVLRLAFEPNVEVRLFNPLPGSRASLFTRIVASIRDIDRVQKRMHNKLFIADNAMGIAGGRNLGDAYFGGGGKSNFVDLDVLAAGRIVRDMSASFDRYWNDELSYPMQKLVTPEQLEAIRKPASAPDDGASKAAPPPSPTASSVLPYVTPTAVVTAQPAPYDLRKAPFTWAPAILLADKPGKIVPGDDEVEAGDTVVDGLLDLMAHAKDEVLIVSPYFVPGREMMGVFERLRAQGVRVRVLTNSLASNDAPAAHAGYARYRKDLVRLGVELFEMRADQHGASGGLPAASGFGGSSGAGGGIGGSKTGTSHASLHSKAVVIDGRLAVIGSMNLDLRSQRKNSEVGLLIRSTAIARQATRQIEDTIAQGAYRLETRFGELVWRAPPGAKFGDERSEPEATAKQRMLVQLIAPFAPEEML